LPEHRRDVGTKLERQTAKWVRFTSSLFGCQLGSSLVSASPRGREHVRMRRTLGSRRLPAAGRVCAGFLAPIRHPRWRRTPAARTPPRPGAGIPRLFSVQRPDRDRRAVAPTVLPGAFQGAERNLRRDQFLEFGSNAAHAQPRAVFGAGAASQTGRPVISAIR